LYVCKQSDSVSISLRRAYSKIEMNSVERSGERGSPLEVDGIARLDVVLRENELEWRHIADAIAVNVVVQSTTGTCLFANRTALEYWGLKLDDVMVANYRAPVHPDDAAQMYARRQDGLAKGIPLETELRSRRRDGKYRWRLSRLPRCLAVRAPELARAGRACLVFPIGSLDSGAVWHLRRALSVESGQQSSRWQNRPDSW